ncbi:unnamed protein product [Nezara viridula]|uniref:Uncharacterized protein n=1 Tax=Nezara viridula TaxID=85310 RepID=A0A9P0HTB9_NEZVI|nr:unnamed protein product [Nezara viridula]
MTYYCWHEMEDIDEEYHRDTQETLAVLDRLDLDSEKPSDEEMARKFGFEEDYFKGTVSWWQRLKPQLCCGELSLALTADSRLPAYQGV